MTTSIESHLKLFAKLIFELPKDFIRSLAKFLQGIIVKWINVDREFPIQLDITNACNLNCNHCYHSHHRNEAALNLNQWLSILDQYDKLIDKMGYKPYLILCGGEPFTSPLMEPLLREIIKRPTEYRIVIISNGTLLHKSSPSLTSLFKQFSKISFQISFDGPNSASHDSVRGPGAFMKALAGVDFLKTNGFKVSIITILSKRTSALIEEFFSLAASLKVTRLGFVRLISEGNASKMVECQNDRPLNPTELHQTYSKILKASSEYGIKSNSSDPLMHLVHPGLGRTGRFFEGLVIDYQGHVLASSRSRIKLGSVLKDGLEKIYFQSKLLEKIRKGEIETCGSCPHLKICGGDRNAAYAHSGNYLGQDPGCWLPLLSSSG